MVFFQFSSFYAFTGFLHLFIACSICFLLCIISIAKPSLTHARFFIRHALPLLLFPPRFCFSSCAQEWSLSLFFFFLSPFYLSPLSLSLYLLSLTFLVSLSFRIIIIDTIHWAPCEYILWIRCKRDKHLTNVKTSHTMVVIFMNMQWTATFSLLFACFISRWIWLADVLLWKAGFLLHPL